MGVGPIACASMGMQDGRKTMHSRQSMRWMLGVLEMSFNIYQRSVGGVSRIRCSVDTREEAEVMVADLQAGHLGIHNRFYWLKDMSAGDEE